VVDQRDERHHRTACQVEGWDQTRALVLIGEAVWLVTIVDATLVRCHVQANSPVCTTSGPTACPVVTP